MTKKRKSPRKATVKGGEAKIKMGKHFIKISKAPLKRQKSSDAWNERDNKLVASRTGAKLLIKGTIEKNKAKAAIKKRKRTPIKKGKPRGSRSSK